MNYAMRTVSRLGFADAVAKTREALAREGFGVITEIDVQKTMKEKLGVEQRPYVILGACNPQLAHRALAMEPDVGLLLPCNVVVCESGPQMVVAAIDPSTMSGLVGESREFDAVAREARERLSRVIANIGS
jgi:uncharacterized protein (DUF302 family)